PADPLGNIISAAHILWIEASGLFGEIHHDRARFEDRDRRATAHRLIVDDRRHPAVWRNAQELGGELVAATDVDRLDGVRHPELFEQDDALLAVSRWPEIQVNHGISSCSWDRRMWNVIIVGLGCPPCCHRWRRLPRSNGPRLSGSNPAAARR